MDLALGWLDADWDNGGVLGREACRVPVGLPVSGRGSGAVDGSERSGDALCCLLVNEILECGPHPQGVRPFPDDGRRHLGRLEAVLHRRWPAGTIPSPRILDHMDALSRLPPAIVDRVVEEVNGIYIGEGSVADLNCFNHLRGVSTDPDDPQAPTFDRLAGIYRFGFLVLGSSPHTSVSLVFHEIGHVLDVADRMMSETRQWRDLHDACVPHLVEEYWHRRHEWWAECFAITLARKEHVLVTMLGGQVDLAYAIVEYFHTYYGVYGVMA